MARFLLMLPHYTAIRTGFSSYPYNSPKFLIFSTSKQSKRARFLCSCSAKPHHDSVELSKYQETFSNRMAMAGLKPHHRIAVGVSGGPDSMALCLLAANWKTYGLNAASRVNNDFIDGLLAIIVDHGLRAESKNEAETVQHRVLKMGIRCEIAHCEWTDGKPKLGHLQEAARDMRYEKLQRICSQHRIGALLIAHHADDQAELFILRLSRNSGVLGLAGMALATQLFPTHLNCDDGISSSILLVRPLLDFSKQDLYNICEGGQQKWVEDPTNQSTIFARNRIRMSLKNLSSSIFKSELQAIILACRRTRVYVDQICQTLIDQAVTVMPQGYAIIDLEILNPSEVPDICLSKFVTLLLQGDQQQYEDDSNACFSSSNPSESQCFEKQDISDDDILTAKPGKEDYQDTSYLLRQASPFMNIKFESIEEQPLGNKRRTQTLPKADLAKRVKLNSNEVCMDDEIKGGILHQPHKDRNLIGPFISQRQRPVRGRAQRLLLDYLRTFPCKSSFTAAGCYLCAAPGSKGSKIIICCSVYSALPMSMESFYVVLSAKQKMNTSNELSQIIENGKSYSSKAVPNISNLHFLNKISSSESILTEAKQDKIVSEPTFTSILALYKTEFEKFQVKTETLSDLKSKKVIEPVKVKELGHGQIGHFMDRFLVSWEFVGGNDGCCCCSGQDLVMEVRHMVDADWLYLSELIKSGNLENCQLEEAKRSLLLLKSIPVAARRSLPVLVNCEGRVVSIPSVCFSICKCLKVSVEFNPRVPLGGGYSSFL